MAAKYPEHRPNALTLKEADTCRVYITPALVKAGWGDPRWRIKEQHCFTDGQVILVGNGHKRLKKKKADYLLRYQESFPIRAVRERARHHGRGSSSDEPLCLFQHLPSDVFGFGWQAVVRALPEGFLRPHHH